MSSFKVAIVGGGLAGSLIANGLIKNGVDVAVYERDPERSERGGYQIRLGQYSLDAFRLCLDPSHVSTIEQKFGMSSARDAQSLYTAPSIYSTGFKPVIDLGRLPSYSASTAIDRVVLRDFLVGPLKDHGKIKFGQNFTRYEIVQTGDAEEKVRLHFTDGTTDSCDILIGADGSASTINKQVGLQNTVDISTHWVFVVKGGLTPEQIEKLPKRLQSGPLLVFHEGAVLYYALYLPAKAEKGTESNVLFNYDLTEASFYWSLIMPKKHSGVTNREQITNRLQFCLDYVKDWAPEYQTMLSIGSTNKDSAPVAMIPLRASKKPSKQWREVLRRGSKDSTDMKGHPRIWLIGDSIHAMQPNRGMGGNQAMYDCVEMLPELLQLSALSQSQKGVSTNQVDRAVKSYEGKMLDRAFKWVQKSGGTSVPDTNFNGLLGLLLSTVNAFILPVILWIFQSFRKVTR